MYERRVTHIRTNEVGEIIGLGNPETWGTVSSAAAKFHIRHNMYHYYVVDDNTTVYVQITYK